jgi:hypothetical protein
MMALIKNNFAIAATVFAATSLTATPSIAAELPKISKAHASAYDSDAENAYNHRWRGYRRNHVRTGDVIAGVLVLGTLAAIASSSNNRRERERDSDVRYREPVRNDRRDNRGWSTGGIDSAVNMCVDQVERGRDRVDSVDNASRNAGGWQVSGSLEDGTYFSCRIDNEGRIRSIDLGDDFAANTAEVGKPGPQLSDETYARARASLRGQEATGLVDYDIDADLRPAYPGGPLPGEEGYEAALES